MAVELHNKLSSKFVLKLLYVITKIYTHAHTLVSIIMIKANKQDHHRQHYNLDNKYKSANKLKLKTSK